MTGRAGFFTLTRLFIGVVCFALVAIPLAIMANLGAKTPQKSNKPCAVGDRNCATASKPQVAEVGPSQTTPEPSAPNPGADMGTSGVVRPAFEPAATTHRSVGEPHRSRDYSTPRSFAYGSGSKAPSTNRAPRALGGAETWERSYPRPNVGGLAGPDPSRGMPQSHSVPPGPIGPSPQIRPGVNPSPMGPAGSVASMAGTGKSATGSMTPDRPKCDIYPALGKTDPLARALTDSIWAAQLDAARSNLDPATAQKRIQLAIQAALIQAGAKPEDALRSLQLLRRAYQSCGVNGEPADAALASLSKVVEAQLVIDNPTAPSGLGLAATASPGLPVRTSLGTATYAVIVF